MKKKVPNFKGPQDRIWPFPNIFLVIALIDKFVTLWNKDIPDGDAGDLDVPEMQRMVTSTGM